jgi:transposase
MLGAGLLAPVSLSKYGDHLPLNRHRTFTNANCVELPRSTLANWVGAAA